MIFAGNEGGVLEPVDVSSLVAEMIGLLKVSVSKRAILTTHLDNGLPAVRAIPAQIRQVVMNLVINASEALGNREGAIRVVTERVTVDSGSEVWKPKSLEPGDYLQLKVSDSGCGMTPETQRRAFDPFYTTKFAGRGMGLAVVQQIVHQLGGAVHLISSPDQGTTVLVLLPWTCETIRPNRGTVAVSAVPAQIRSTVMVVDDEPTLLAAMSKMLRRKGYSVIQATNGNTALELLRDERNQIDTMLLDVTLPGVSSREVVEQAGRLRPDMVMILTSAYSHESVENSFAGLRVPHFIRKPCPIEDLLSLLQQTRTGGSTPAHAQTSERRL
jgi:CheY-like chemotaxis protein